MANLPKADITSFTDEQFKAFQNAAALGSGVQVTDNGNTYVVDKNTGPRTITAASLTPTAPITLPQPQPDKTDYMTGIAGTAAQIAEGMKTDATTDTEQTDLQKMLASITTPSGVDAYNAAGTSLGIDTAQADALAARRAKRAAQSELAGIQGQVQAVVDRATVENLKLEQNINVGSTGLGGAGALASSSFLNVRQQEVNRQAAITALPLQALALAAQAKVASLTGEEEYAQSTLKAAQDKLDTTFKLWSDDADRKQTLQLKMLDIVIAQGNKKEAARAEALKEITTRNQSDLKDSRDFAQSQSVIAKDSGQMNIAAKFAQLTPPDPTSKTFAADLQAYNEKISALQGQIVENKAPTVSNINGVDMQWNPATKSWQPIGGGSTTPSGTVGGYPAGSPEAKQYQTVLSTILGSGKFTKDQSRAVTNAINNGEDPFTVVKNQAKTLLGQTGDTKLTSYEVAREQLTAVQNSLTQYYSLGGKTNIFAGNYEKVINKLGEVSDPKLVSIAVEIASSLQIYRNAVSGTAYSVQEGVDIASIFPGINKSQGLNTAILAGRAKAFDSTIDSTYRSVLGKSYDELKKLNSGQSTSDTTIDIPSGKVDVFDSVINTPQEGGYFSKLWSAITGK